MELCYLCCSTPLMCPVTFSTQRWVFLTAFFSAFFFSLSMKWWNGNPWKVCSVCWIVKPFMSSSNPSLTKRGCPDKVKETVKFPKTVVTPGPLHWQWQKGHTVTDLRSIQAIIFFLTAEKYVAFVEGCKNKANACWLLSSKRSQLMSQLAKHPMDKCYNANFFIIWI